MARISVLAAAVLLVGIFFLGYQRMTIASAATSQPIAAPTLDDQLAPQPGTEKAVFAGGCFWGTQSVFQRVKGVTHTEAGYAGGSQNTATYDQVTTETTGHAESVEITFDPSKITYGTLLRIFFSVAHDPTTLNRQGPDQGTSYRSAIFYESDQQHKIAEAYIHQLDQARAFHGKIVTELTPLKASTTQKTTTRTTPPKTPTTPTSKSATSPKPRLSQPSSPSSSKPTKATS